MKNLHVNLGILTALALSALSSSAWADTYDINFTASTPDDTVASGQLTVVGDVATGGYLDVTAGPDVGDYTLVTGSGSDSSFDFDNYVDPGSSDGFVDSTAGLLWSLSGNDYSSEEVNMWYNPTAQYGAPADSYSFWGALPDWNLEAYGTATLTPVSGNSVSLSQNAPDGGFTVILLGGALLGLQAFRKLSR